MEALPKALNFGSFHLHAKVGQGGMADVLLATSSRKELQGQLLAVKKLLPHLNANKAFVNLLIHEAKVGILLTHPGIVSVVDLGSHQSEFFIAMEFVHGKSLDELLKKLENSRQRGLSLELASYIVMEIVRALAFAHDLKDNKDRELNIIHRDISPGNILLGYTGEVKLTDFGISTAENRLQPVFTKNALGKIGYIPPEQALNDPAQRSSDLYSLSVVYFQLLTGMLPFDFKSINDLIRGPAEFSILNDYIRDRAPQIPPSIREFLSRSLNRQPKNRHQSAAEYFHTLKEVLEVELKTDFFARATRQYFKKRLSEKLREVFSPEIEFEKKIVSSALLFSQQPPQTLDNAFPENSFASPTEVTLLEEELSLEPTTISENKSLNDTKLSLEDKLRISSLSNDQAEYLQNSRPSVEILSEADQDAFESKTLTIGNPDTPPPQMKTPAVAGKVFNLQDTKPAGVSPSQSVSAIRYSADRLRRSISTSIGFISKSALKLLWLPTLGFIVASILWLLLGGSPFKSSTKFGILSPTQTVRVIVSGEATSDQIEALLNSIKESEKGSNLSRTEAFFNKEYFKYTKSFQRVLQIKWEARKLENSQLSQSQDFLNLIRSEEILKKIPITLVESEPTLIIYTMPQERQTAGIIVRSQKDDNGFSLLLASPSLGHTQELQIQIAFEIAKLFGATDKLDSETQIPLFPDGFSNPEAKPLYPQSAAELMAKYIPVSPLKKRWPNNFDEVSVGQTTARELGWTD